MPEAIGGLQAQGGDGVGYAGAPLSLFNRSFGWYLLLLAVDSWIRAALNQSL